MGNRAITKKLIWNKAAKVTSDFDSKLKFGLNKGKGTMAVTNE